MFKTLIGTSLAIGMSVAALAFAEPQIHLEKRVVPSDFQPLQPKVTCSIYFDKIVVTRSIWPGIELGSQETRAVSFDSSALSVLKKLTLLAANGDVVPGDITALDVPLKTYKSSGTTLLSLARLPDSVEATERNTAPAASALVALLDLHCPDTTMLVDL